METTEKSKKTTTKGSKTTEIIIGSAAAKLTNAVAGMRNAVIEVEKLEGRANDATLQVVNLEDQIGSLKSELSNQKSQNQLELKLAYESDKQSFVSQFLAEKDSKMVSNEEWQKVNNDLYIAKNEQDRAINTAVASATNALKSAHANEIKVAELQHASKEAANNAEITQLKNQNKFLEEQVTMWKAALDAERAAGIERAKAGAINTLNVGGTTQGR